MVTEKLSLLILGGGAVVSEYYLPALYRLGLIDQAVIVDISPSSIGKWIKKYPCLRVKKIDFASYLENCKEASFDAAIIALPNYLHADAARVCLMKGFHVSCEKPLAMSRQDCLDLAHLSEKTGKILTVGMVRRLLPSTFALRNAYNSGLIGPLQNVDIEWGGRYAWLSDSGVFFQRENGGVLMDMGVHYLDMIMRLGGSLSPIAYKDDYRGGVEANLEFELKLDGEIPVKMTLSRTHRLRNTLVLKGEKGELVLEKDTFDYCLWHSYSLKNITTRLYPKDHPHTKDGPSALHACFDYEISRFINTLRSGAQPDVSAYEAAKIISLIEWAYVNRKNIDKEADDRYFMHNSQRPSIPSSPVTVTGGTGFIGGHLIERLAESSVSDITIPVRNYRTCSHIARFPVKMKRTNILDYGEVKDAIGGSRFVFHLAYGRDGDDAARITIQGTKNIVNASIECGVDAVVILSTMYVFGHPAIDGPIDEKWPYHPAGGEYGISKMAMEQWCLNRAKRSGRTRIIVLNPSCVYGPRGSTYTELPINLTRSGRFCWVEEGNGIANYTFVDNLIDAILLAAQCEQAHGERFIINDGSCSWRTFLEPLLGEFANCLPSFSEKELRSLNRTRSASFKDLLCHFANNPEFIDIINRMPIFGKAKRLLLKNAPKLRATLVGFQHGQISLPYADFKTGGEDCPPAWLADLFGPTKTRFSAKKAEAILHWRPLVSLREGQEKTSAWLKSVTGKS